MDAISMWDGAAPTSATARRDVSSCPERVVGEHFAYQRTMLALARRDDVDVVHLNGVHHLPVAMSPLLDCPVTATLHCPPVSWLELAHRELVRDDNPLDVVAVSRHLARTLAARARRPGRGDRERGRAGGVATGPRWWRVCRLVRPSRAGEGAAPRDRGRAPGRPADHPRRSGPRPGVLRGRGRAPARDGCDVGWPARPVATGRAVRPGRGDDRQLGVGRTVRVGRRRIAGVRDAGGHDRPRCAARRR